MSTHNDKTLTYYNQNARSFSYGTISVDFRQTQDKFLTNLPQASHILDFGCGSGRDTKYFLTQGHKVDAIDGSKELCKMATAYTGIQVKQMLFQELTAHEKYDGIWACSSILHLPREELKTVLRKMADALKQNGIAYTSFKHSEFEGERAGRYFTDFTMATFTDFMQQIDCFTIEEHWITSDVRPGRGEEKWLNLILRKK